MSVERPQQTVAVRRSRAATTHTTFIKRRGLQLYMDSASPIAQRTAGEYALGTSATFTTAMWITNAENTLKRFGFDPSPRFDPKLGSEHGRSGGYRHRYHRSYGEGHPA
jgi:hypothetical protein